MSLATQWQVSDRFPMVSLEFIIDITRPSTLWSWDRLSL